MTIKDRIYGKVKIEEPVLVELLKSPSVLRLKNISQFGVPDKYYHLRNYSRYEHSFGVMILLRKLGATLEEQVAGLLHDVSVLAFSHVIDWVFANGRDGVEDYHDKIHGMFINNTEIPKILEKFDFDLERIINVENFPLLERKIPDLCTDRIDYALREIPSKIVHNCPKGLMNYNGEIVFTNKKSAWIFATNFLKRQTNHWGGYEAMMRYHLFSKVLKRALDLKILSDKDFYKNERFVLNKIEKSQDKMIREILKLLENKPLKKAKNNSGKKIFKKFRYVDPLVLMGLGTRRLSNLRPEFSELLTKHREENKLGVEV